MLIWVWPEPSLRQKDAAPAACHPCAARSWCPNECMWPFWEQPKWRQGPFGPGAPLRQPSLILRPPCWGLLRFRWKCHKEEWRGCHTEWHGLLYLRSRFGIAFSWVCERDKRLLFFPSRTRAEQSFYSFLHISHATKSQGWLQGAPHQCSPKHVKLLVGTVVPLRLPTHKSQVG